MFSAGLFFMVFAFFFFLITQVRGHSTVPSAGPPSPRRETCFATSNCTPGRSLSNVPCAATPAVDATLWAATCAHILVPASHTLAHSVTCEADMHWYLMHLCTVSCWLVSHSFMLVSHSLWIWTHEVCWACMAFPVTPCHALGYTHYMWHLTHLPLETCSFTFSSRVLPADTLHILQYAHHQFCMKPLKEIILAVPFRCCWCFICWWLPETSAHSREAIQVQPLQSQLQTAQLARRAQRAVPYVHSEQRYHWERWADSAHSSLSDTQHLWNSEMSSQDTLHTCTYNWCNVM